jgi:ABC-type transporter Mla MlaB component
MSSPALRRPIRWTAKGVPLPHAAETSQIAVDLTAIERPDAVLVDAIARLELAARRAGRTVCVHNAPRGLQELVDFMGLGELLRLEPRRQPEEREQRLGVEEGRELDDPAV